MIGLWLAISGAALAQAEDDASVQGEVVVYGDWLVERARVDLVEQAKASGYTHRIERDGYVLYRSPDTWRGDLRVYDDGWVRITRQPVQFRPPNSASVADAKISSWLWCVWPTNCVNARGLWVSKRKFDAQRGRAYGGIYPEVTDWADALANRAVDKRLDVLPDQLEALWERGVPIPGLEPLPVDSLVQRRDAILQFWDTRADNLWGDKVRESTEAFLNGVVQASEAAISSAEIARFNERRSCKRELHLLSRQGPLE